MTYSKINIIYHLQKWMDSVAGQTFLNYAYSWGASIVILGTLFKLTHLPMADLFLYLGMGTEVFVFFISAFDRPFDKTTDGMNLKAENGINGAGKTEMKPLNVLSEEENKQLHDAYTEQTESVRCYNRQLDALVRVMGELEDRMHFFNKVVTGIENSIRHPEKKEN